MNREELKKKLEQHEKWLNDDIDGVKLDLSYTNLIYSNLKYRDLRGANLRGADLRNSNLEGSDLTNANLESANLSDVDLTDVDLRGADLINANLTNADLTNANLESANLDYSCLPLWCGSLNACMDDKQVIQLLYHTLSIVIHSTNISDELKEKLLTQDNLEIANKFHRVDECGVLKKEV